MLVNIITLGCSKNTVDSEFIATRLRAAGHRVFFDRVANDCDMVVVNTCGFIGDAKEESVNVLLEQIEAKNRFNRRHAGYGRRRRLVAMGCLVQRYREELGEEMSEVDEWCGVPGSLVFDPSRKDKPEVAGEEAINRYVEPCVYNDASRLLSTPRHYAYMKISEGCNRCCSYCAIPLIRGKHVSRPIDELVEEAKTLVRHGVKELLLIAQDTTYYGLDLYGRRCLGELLERLALESGAEWIRLHYTYPSSFPVDAIEAIRKYDNICKYIDIPLQHINSRILHSMQRGIDREGTLALLEQFRQMIPGVCIRTTLIVGYPGETEAEFEELKQFVQAARFDRMGCFAYSPEEGTAAYELDDDVPDEEKQRRVDELMALQQQISLERNESRIGNEYKVIIDRKEGDYYVARTQYDSPDIDDEVLISADRRLRTGGFYNVRITKALEHDLMAELL